MAFKGSLTLNIFVPEVSELKGAASRQCGS